MWVLTQGEADANPVGIARQEPNVSPQLTIPSEGRGWGDYLTASGFSFNFNLFGRMYLIGGAVIFVLLLLLLIQMGVL